MNGGTEHARNVKLLYIYIYIKYSRIKKKGKEKRNQRGGEDERKQQLEASLMLDVSRSSDGC